MRTTLNLDDQILAKVKMLSSQRGVTVGRIVSELIAKALAPEQGTAIRNGVRVFARRGGGSPDIDLVNQLRD